MKRTRLAKLGLGLTVVLLVGLFTSGQLEAAGTVGDGTPGSCTEAALTAALAGGGLVTFNCGPAPVTIVLSSQYTVVANTMIDGGGKVTLSGGDSTSLFHVSLGFSLELDNLALSNGSAGQGGAIYNDGRLTVANSVLFDNDAPGGMGGAVYNAGTMTLRNSTLSGNAAGAGVSGGIHNAGTLTIVDSFFSDNFGGLGGGALGNSGVLVISGSQFEGNQAPGGGGAINNSGSLNIDNSTFASNTAASGYGGGIYNGNSMTITNSTLSGNVAGTRGGSIYNSGHVSVARSTLSGNSVNTGAAGGCIYNDLLASLAIDSSTLANNSAPGGSGGGIYNRGKLVLTADTLSGNAAGAGLGGAVANTITGTLTVVNSTFSGNAGGLAGGGILTSGAVTLTNSTFYSNTAGGLVTDGSNPLKVKNTIVANNITYNCSGPITSLGYNLESANSCSFAMAGDLTNTNPLLGPLAKNGGPTLTHSPLPGSPAINAGTNTDCPATDQRGVPRPQFGTCDIGAVEYVVRVYLPLVFK